MSTTCLLQEPKAITSFPQHSLLGTCDHATVMIMMNDDDDNDDDYDDGFELMILNLSKTENATYIYVCKHMIMSSTHQKGVKWIL